MRKTNGQFAKGNAGGGRPKGSKNRSTTELRSFINNFINNNLDLIQEDFENLDPKERVNAFIKLLEYSIPKLNRTELMTEIEQKKPMVVVDLGSGVKPKD